MEHGRIPNSLKKHRRIAGLSQIQVAAILGIKNSCSICLWEKGSFLPGAKQLFQLCILYNTTPETLFGELFHTLRQELFAHSEPIIPNDIPL
jgi:transcriptional regulator with XRE-family HTH domain